MTRFRIEDSKGRIWDSSSKRWRSNLDGRYNTYRSHALATAAARKAKSPVFWAAESKRIVEDR